MSTIAAALSQWRMSGARLASGLAGAPFVRKAAICWASLAAIVYALDLTMQTSVGLTNGRGRPFGDDFINYWSGAWLAWHDRVAAVYDWHAFHAFEECVARGTLDFYHYSYPPALLLLSAPLAALPYVPALAVWLSASWLAFFQALRSVDPSRPVFLLALATPAVFINAVGGQNGAWTAALLGGGLSLLERRPIAAGVLFGLLVYKPHLGVLLPIVLAAGGHWRCFVSAAGTVLAVVGLSVLMFGVETWLAYAKNVDLLRQTILEDGTGVWHRMASVFVGVRRLGFDPTVAYAVQVATALVCAAAAAWVFRRNAVHSGLKAAIVVVGTCLSTPYLQDYDLVVGAFVAVWLVLAAIPSGRTAAVAVLLLPLAIAPIGGATGIAVGPFVLAAVFSILVRGAVTPPAAGIAARHPEALQARSPAANTALLHR